MKSKKLLESKTRSKRNNVAAEGAAGDGANKVSMKSTKKSLIHLLDSPRVSLTTKRSKNTTSKAGSTRSSASKAGNIVTKFQLDPSFSVEFCEKIEGESEKEVHNVVKYKYMDFWSKLLREYTTGGKA